MSGQDPAAEDLIALIPPQFICLGIHFQVETKWQKCCGIWISRYSHCTTFAVFVCFCNRILRYSHFTIFPFYDIHVFASGGFHIFLRFQSITCHIIVGFQVLAFSFLL